MPARNRIEIWFIRRTPVLARKLWPRLQTKKTKAISAEQHARLVATEKDKEFRLYLEVLWEIGDAQTDTARLRRENVDLLNRQPTTGKSWRMQGKVRSRS